MLKEILHRIRSLLENTSFKVAELGSNMLDKC